MKLLTLLLPLMVAAAASCSTAKPASSPAQDPVSPLVPSLTNRTNQAVELQVVGSSLVVSCGIGSWLGQALRDSAFEHKWQSTTLAPGQVQRLPDSAQGPFPGADCPAYRVRARLPGQPWIDRVVLMPPAWQSTGRHRELVLREHGHLEVESSEPYHAPTISPFQPGAAPACQGPLPERLPRWLSPTPEPDVSWRIAAQRSQNGCLLLELDPDKSGKAKRSSWMVCVPEGGWPFVEGDTLRVGPASQRAEMMVRVPGIGLLQVFAPTTPSALRLERVGADPVQVELHQDGTPGGSAGLDGPVCEAVRNGCQGLWAEGQAKLGPEPLLFPQHNHSTYQNKQGATVHLLVADYRWLVATASRCSANNGETLSPGTRSGYVEILRPKPTTTIAK